MAGDQPLALTPVMLRLGASRGTFVAIAWACDCVVINVGHPLGVVGQRRRFAQGVQTPASRRGFGPSLCACQTQPLHHDTAPGWILKPFRKGECRLDQCFGDMGARVPDSLSRRRVFARHGIPRSSLGSGNGAKNIFARPLVCRALVSPTRNRQLRPTRNRRLVTESIVRSRRPGGRS